MFFNEYAISLLSFLIDYQNAKLAQVIKKLKFHQTSRKENCNKKKILKFIEIY